MYSCHLFPGPSVVQYPLMRPSNAVWVEWCNRHSSRMYSTTVCVSVLLRRGSLHNRSHSAWSASTSRLKWIRSTCTRYAAWLSYGHILLSIISAGCGVEMVGGGGTYNVAGRNSGGGIRSLYLSPVLKPGIFAFYYAPYRCGWRDR